MSGIAGMANLTEDILQKSISLCAMSDAIGSRGITGAGYFISDHVAFLRRIGEFGPNGNTFVAELSLKGKTYVLVLDGTIYNLKELACGLELDEYSSLSCSEILLHAYVRWQEKLLEKINGSFSLALWIQEDRTLILARDHHGIKPLYYSTIDGTLFFSSDIRGITCHPKFKGCVDKEGISELICLNPRHTPGSGVVKGVYQVRPGHYLKFNLDGIKVLRYWFLNKGSHEDDMVKTLDTIRELVLDSVKRRLPSDVPLCGFLSGGLYSSLITAVAADHPALLNSSIYNTWSVDFERSNRFLKFKGQGSNSDIPWIRWVCRRANTRHHYIILSSTDMVGALIESEEARGLPGIPDYDTSLLLLCREIQKDYNIVLAGDCSDEIFSSAYRIGENYITGKRRLPWTANLAEKISIFKNEIIDFIKPYEFIEKCYEEALADYRKFSVFDNCLKKEKEAQWFGLYWNLPCFLERLDTMSMACGLEARVPFCDYRLTEYFWNIPQELKRLNNLERGLLREAMRGYLPSDILERKRNPYPHFYDTDYEEKIKDMLYETVLDPSSPVKYLLNTRTLESMMKQPLDFSRKYTTRAWLYGWIIQLNNFLLRNGIAPF